MKQLINKTYLISLILFGQMQCIDGQSFDENNNLSLIQGKWVNYDEDKTYWNIKGTKLTEIVESSEGNIYKNFYEVGFSDVKGLDEKDSFSVNTLKDKGEYFYIANLGKSKKYFTFSVGYKVTDLNKFQFSILGPRPITYKRINEFPQKINKVVNNCIISLPKAYIYSSIKPEIKTKMYLIKGDKVEIIEENGEWIKIRYFGKKVIEGWIKRSDIK